MISFTVKILCIILTVICLVGCSGNKSNKSDELGSDKQAEVEYVGNITDTVDTLSCVLHNYIGGDKLYLVCSVDFSDVDSFYPLTLNNKVFDIMYYEYYNNSETGQFACMQKQYLDSNSSNEVLVRNTTWGNDIKADLGDWDVVIDFDGLVYSEGEGVDFYAKKLNVGKENFGDKWTYKDYTIYPISYSDDIYFYHIFNVNDEYEAITHMLINSSSNKIDKENVHSILDDMSFEFVDSLDELDTNKQYLEDYIAKTVSDKYGIALTNPGKILSSNDIQYYFEEEGDSYLCKFDVSELEESTDDMDFIGKYKDYNVYEDFDEYRFTKEAEYFGAMKNYSITISDDLECYKDDPFSIDIIKRLFLYELD